MYCPYCMKQIADNLSNCPYCKQDVRIENSPFQLPIETILAGRYYVGKAIGQGGFGITYVCCDLKLQMRVAIKEYFPQGIVGRISTYSTQLTVSGEEQRTLFAAQKERFLLEARILAEFAGDSHIVRISDIFSENNTTYIVMEYVEGITLDEYVNQHGTMSFSAVFRMLKPIMNTLGAIHEKGLIHRDISPANIIISSKGEAKLLDFGAARSYAGQEQSISVILKPGYAPFEQYSSHGSQGPWTDIYALCATIYKSITGLVPKNSFERMKNDDLAYPTYLKAGISEMEEAVLMRGMAVQSEDRFQTMEKLLAAFLYAGYGKVDAETERYINPQVKKQRETVYISNPVNISTDHENSKNDDRNQIAKKSPYKLIITLFTIGILGALLAVFLYRNSHFLSSNIIKENNAVSEISNASSKITTQSSTNNSSSSMQQKTKSVEKTSTIKQSYDENNPFPYYDSNAFNYYECSFDLGKGDSGDEVIKLQEALIDLGYLKGSATGYFDHETEESIKDFSANNAITCLSSIDFASQFTQEILYGNTAVRKNEPAKKSDILLEGKYIANEFSYTRATENDETVKSIIEIDFTNSASIPVNAIRLICWIEDKDGNCLENESHWGSTEYKYYIEPGETEKISFVYSDDFEDIKDAYYLKAFIAEIGYVTGDIFINYRTYQNNKFSPYQYYVKNLVQKPYISYSDNSST